jgi:hypothetical protein
MTKPKTWEDPEHSFDADWPSHQPITLMDLVAGARAVEWDFTTWCYASGYDASDPDAHLMFECFAGLRQGRGPRRLELTVGLQSRQHHVLAGTSLGQSALIFNSCASRAYLSKSSRTRRENCSIVPPDRLLCLLRQALADRSVRERLVDLDI